MDTHVYHNVCLFFVVVVFVCKHAIETNRSKFDERLFCFLLFCFLHAFAYVFDMGLTSKFVVDNET